jgi:MFS family permease
MPRRHRFGGLLWQRSFRLLWFGETISQLGNAMAIVGVPLVAVIVLHASTLAVGVLSAAAWLPWLLIGLPAGAWVDRLPAGRVMITCDVISALLYASVPAAAWAGELSIGLVLAVQLLAGAVSVVFMTAYQVYLPSLVAAQDLIEGNTKMQGSASASAFAGPSLAGLVAQLLGAVTALLFNALSFLVSAACLLGTRRATAPAASARRPGSPAGPDPGSATSAAPRPGSPAGSQAPRPGSPAASQAPRPRTSVRREAADGLRLVLGDPYLRQMSVFWAVANLALSGYLALVVVFLVRVVRLTPELVGLLAAAPGAGGVIGALLTGRITARFGTARALLLSTWCAVPFALLIPLTGPGPRLACYLVGALVAYTGIAVGNIIIAAFRQSYAPPGMCGRVSATMRFLIFATSPIGALLGGGLGTWLGVRDALWILLGLATLSGTLLLTPALTRTRNLPTGPAPALTLGASAEDIRPASSRPGDGLELSPDPAGQRVVGS